MSKEANTASPGSTSSSPPSPEGRGSKSKRKAPRWTVAFLRALERCGQVRQAARDAGVDHTTAYQRQRAHPDFAAQWKQAVAAFKAGQSRGEAIGLPPPARLPELEHRIRNGKLRRVAYGRWGKEKERIWLAELHASGNFHRAAKAVGLSEQAIARWRGKDPRLEEAAIAACLAARERLNGMVIAAGNRAFTPDELPDPGDSSLPPVTVREAIDILKLPGPGGKASRASGEPELAPYNAEDVAERLRKRLDLIREESLSNGYQFDEEYQSMAPPGWIKGPDYNPPAGD